MAEGGPGPWGRGSFMTSAVHGGIHNVSRHVVGLGRVGDMSAICEPVVLLLVRNKTIIRQYSAGTVDP